MRIGRLHLAICSLLVVFLVVLSVAADPRNTHIAQHTPIPPVGDVSNGLARDSSVFPLITRLRDAVVELVFGQHPSSRGDASQSAFYVPSRYGKQTVVRFHVSTPDEEAALAEATRRIFLDVWSYNNHTGTVDIRINKEDVASLLTLLPPSLHRSFVPLIPDLSVAVQATYPKAAGGAQRAVGTAARLFAAGGSTSSPAMADVMSTGTDNIFFQDYQPLPVIVQWMKLMDAMFPFVELVTVGRSAEGREILGLRVGAAHHDDDGDAAGDGSDNDSYINIFRAWKKKRLTRTRAHKAGDEAKTAEPEPEEPEQPEQPEEVRAGAQPEPAKRKTILVTGGLHAREWITTSTANYVAWSVITGNGKSPMITKLLKHFDLVFVPVANPDGYEYTWHTDRLWRKTRQATSFRYCRGLDLDHAFGYAWDHGNDNARAEPCAETYGGGRAFEAVEARTLAAWARDAVALGNVEFVGFLDLHAYSQQILFPFAYSCAADPPNLENLEELAAGIAKAIRLTTGESYTVASACEGALPRSHVPLAPATTRIEAGGGSAIDWFYHELHAKYSYQIKLRDTGSYGFLLPASEIVPTGEEIFNVVKYFGDFLLGNNGIERSYAAAAADPPTAPVPADDDQRDDGLELRKRRRR